MSTDTASDDAHAPPPAGFDLDWRIARAFARFSTGFWHGESARHAWGLTVALGVFLVLSTGVTVALNQWNRWFFDALERKDAAALWQAAGLFFVIIAAMAGIGVGIVLARERLQVRWRAWMIGDLVTRWLWRQRFYHMAADGTQPANPEYRIADDSRWATEPLVDMAIGLVIAVFGAAAFISILWTVGGTLRVSIGGSDVHVPAYMVLVALAYGGIASLLAMWVGRPLIGMVGRKNEAEGDFRFALMRLRDNAESVALMRGELAERAILARIYANVVDRWLAIVRRHGLLTWVTNASGPMIPIVPLLAAAPKYLQGELSLGQVTQIAAAFVQVQLAISWMVDNYSRIADWYASARRVMDMVHASEAADRGLDAAAGRIVHDGAPAAMLALHRVAVEAPAGQRLIDEASLVVWPGQATRVAGETSVGKTSLVRAIAGLWRKGAGTITRPGDLRIMVAPQGSYLPLGTLRTALDYPADVDVATDAAMAEAMTAAGLAHLADGLDRPARWDQLLSAGERQRLTIARALLHKPDVLVLDDALTALDEAAQAQLLGVLRARLPGIAILMFGQSPPPLDGGRPPLVLAKGSEGARLGAHDAGEAMQAPASGQTVA